MKYTTILVLSLIASCLGGSVTTTVTYSGSSTCNLCGSTSYLISSSYTGPWNNGISTFFDPVPAGAKVISISVETTAFFWCTSSGLNTATFLLGGTTIGSASSNYNCLCNTCPAVQTAASGTYDVNTGWPGYVYGGVNTFQITSAQVVGGRVVTVHINYDFPIVTTAVPTTAVPTTAVPTTAVPTTGVPTTAVPTSDIPTSDPTNIDTINGNTTAGATDGINASSGKGNKVNSTTVGIIAGFSILGFIVIVLLVLVVFILLRRKNNNNSLAPSVTVELQAQSNNSSVLATPASPATAYVSLKGELRPAAPMRPIRVSATAQSWAVNYSEIAFGHELGRGAYGVVYLATWRFQNIAVKKIKEQDLTEYERNEFYKEAQLLMSLRPHKNVVAFMGVVLEPLCILTEYLAAGSLANLILTDYKIDNFTLLSFAKDIAAGMAHLHEEGVIHRDLAARNLLLDDKMTVKITDFGMSRVLGGGTNTSGVTKSDVGPLKWMAPESLTQQQYSTKSDVYSFAIVLIELLTRQEPWPLETPLNVAIFVGRDGKRPQIPAHCHPKLRSLIQKLWASDPRVRPEFALARQLLEEIDPKSQ